MDNKPKPGIFSNMNAIDWILALLFIGILAAVGQMILPTYGWIPAIPIALLLLYSAKRKRDLYYTQSDENHPDDKPR